MYVHAPPGSMSIVVWVRFLAEKLSGFWIVSLVEGVWFAMRGDTIKYLRPWVADQGLMFGKVLTASIVLGWSPATPATERQKKAGFHLDQKITPDLSPSGFLHCKPGRR